MINRNHDIAILILMTGVSSLITDHYFFLTRMNSVGGSLTSAAAFENYAPLGVLHATVQS